MIDAPMKRGVFYNGEIFLGEGVAAFCRQDNCCRVDCLTLECAVAAVPGDCPFVHICFLNAFLWCFARHRCFYG